MSILPIHDVDVDIVRYSTPKHGATIAYAAALHPRREYCVNVSEFLPALGLLVDATTQTGAMLD